jgi:hypothetical protein
VEQSLSKRGVTLAEMADFVEKATEEAARMGVPTTAVVLGQARTGLKGQLRRVEACFPANRPTSVTE